jgi:hypothetical protein
MPRAGVAYGFWLMSLNSVVPSGRAVGAPQFPTDVVASGAEVDVVAVPGERRLVAHAAGDPGEPHHPRLAAVGLPELDAVHAVVGGEVDGARRA